ncbi:DUF72 domain-containing protein [Rhodococcus ruber]|uniref:DUF72 domain-containing protein n=1 Tax=Rhodococcus ruber TaxID=1830 RepID=UPI000E6B3FE3|nr:DUF72 domain-containing protein [Rhodococcus ruber]MDV3206975.1 DUF72 domain-containing protein [Rhodococcus ruber]QDC16602.1 DUF72 domain-containing protein [Rhodococcus ruber]RQM35221.1 hypothetical protein TN91_05785 [Rhodococcus ruber]UQB72596.1 DUF72 domain-containing protein [Rhodococcus ruber]
MARVRIGISGWRYAEWRGDFYPAGLVQRRELEYAAERFGSIEINGTFYALQRPSSFLRWRDETPDGFVFAVKGGRYVTHMKRLVDVDDALANFFASGVLALGPKLGPVLWQLPPSLAFEPELIAGFVERLPASTTEAAALAARHTEKVPGERAWTETEADRPLRYALEVRHPSFTDPAAAALLARLGVALVVADTAGRFPFLTEATADFVYVRLHGDTELYASGYAPETLDEWAARIRGWRSEGRDVYVYFDNDIKGYAPWDALELQRRVG